MRKPCCERQETQKGLWSKEEDQKLIDYIKQHGEGCWRSLPRAAGLRRCGKSCRLRWLNYLRPDLKHEDFGEDEEDLIIRLHALLGNRWSLIAGRLPGRTDNEVKNYWNSHIRKKLIQIGHDPNSLPRATIRTGKSLDPDKDDETSNKQVNLGANTIFDDDDQVFDSTSEPKCNLNGFPDLDLDLTLSTNHSSESKIE